MCVHLKTLKYLRDVFLANLHPRFVVPYCKLRPRIESDPYLAFFLLPTSVLFCSYIFLPSKKTKKYIYPLRETLQIGFQCHYLEEEKAATRGHGVHLLGIWG